MKKQITLFRKSFIPNKKHLTSFFTDAITIGLLFMLLFSFSNVLEGKAMGLLQGQDSVEDLQAYFLTAPAEELESYASEIKGFVIVFIISLILILALSLIIYSLSRSLLWHHLLKKKFTFKEFWKWNWLNLFILLAVFIYSLIFTIIKAIIMVLVTVFNVPHLTLSVDYILSFFALIFFLILLFLTYKNFVKEYKLFKSIKLAFNDLGKKWSSLWPTLLGSFIIAALITFLMYVVGLQLQLYPIPLMIVNFVVTFLFLSWFRVYLLDCVE